MYVLSRLERELSPKLIYHSISHTRDTVVPAARCLARVEGLDEYTCELLQTAAYFHDIGFIEQYVDHEEVGIRIAAEILPEFGYGPNDILAIQKMILATKLPQSPQSLPEKILADADLDVLGREDFLKRNRDLRTEMEAFGKCFEDGEWCASQLRFLQTHHYWTEAAQRLRHKTKLINIGLLEKLCDKVSKDGGDK
ncbi:MAG TPA: HD domain-containing protein [Anaerolineales bacterium]|jgi:uncharacterized protein|nr:HD domain-containing protein [Anaerolineales bacterium]